MKLTVTILLGILSLVVGCSESKSPKVQQPATNEGTQGTTKDPFDDWGDDSSGFDDDLDDNSFDASLSPSNCEPGDCPEKKIKIKAIDAKTGNFVRSLKGLTYQNNAWGFVGESADKGRLIGLRFASIPYDAEEQEVEDGRGLALVWLPENPQTGSIKVIARDISRCKNDNDDDEDMQDDCEDMEITRGMSKYEESKSFSFNIKLDPDSKKIEDAERAAEKQKQAQCMTGLVGGMTSLFGAVGGGGTPDLGGIVSSSSSCF